MLNKFFAGSGAEPVGLDMLVTGAVPAGSGLSSSAAMVVASTLTFLTMNDKLGVMTKGDLVGRIVDFLGDGYGWLILCLSVPINR